MPIADIAIAVAVAVSILVGAMRGFVKEAISISALLIAIWASLNFGDDFGALSGGWLSSAELQVWFGRILVFVVIVVVGGLLSWAVAKLVRWSVLSGTDRALGMLFGFCRGAVLVGVFALGGQFAGFNDSSWWRQSLLMPYGEFVADWLRVMAPKGLEFMTPDPDAELPIELMWPVSG
jgi:membrane protein required for colicin V production